MNTQTNTKKTFKKKDITPFIQDDRFGKGAFVSYSLNEEGFSVLQTLQPNDRFVLRPGKYKDDAPVLDKSGNQVFFLEVLPSREGYKPKQNNTATTTGQDDL